MLQSPHTTQQPETGKIFVFSAASGGGKTTLLNHLKTVFPELVYSISATTRAPRACEVDGVHYYFLTPEDFKAKIAANDFAEWACVHEHFYGTPKSLIDRTTNSGKHIIMDIDVFGKIKFDLSYPQAIGILLLPPSLAVLEERLRNRKTDDENTIQVRIANAHKEIDFARDKGKYEYTVVNDNLDTAKAEIVSIVGSHINPSGRYGR